MKTPMAALAATLIAGCATAPPPPPLAPSVVTVGVGEAARLGPLRIRVNRVVEDSRCPAQVQCVWQGRLMVAIFADDPAALARPGGPDAPSVAVAHETVLVLGESKPVLGRMIQLVDAQPQPIAGQMIRSDSYRLTIKLD